MFLLIKLCILFCFFPVIKQTLLEACVMFICFGRSNLNEINASFDLMITYK